MTVIYLDNCAVQRPLDDRTQFRVRVEAEAVEAVLRAVERGAVDLLASDVLKAEVNAALDPIRHDFAHLTLARAVATVALSDDVVRRAQPCVQAGLKAVDALHLASALTGSADFLCTTDDRFLRVAARSNIEALRVVSPLDLAIALDL